MRANGKEEGAALRVVVVDDELPILDELCAFDWDGHGARLLARCENGADALEYCCAHQVDLVICDVVMPVMDGLTLLKKLKEASVPTQFVLLTCHESFRYAQEAIRIGALDYIVKLDMDGALASVLEKARAAAAHARHALSGRDAARRGALARAYRNLAGEAPDFRAFRAQTRAYAPVAYPMDLNMLFIYCPWGEGGVVQEEVLAGVERIAAQNGLGLEAIPLSARRYVLLDRAPSRDVKERLKLLVEALNRTPEQMIWAEREELRAFAVTVGGVDGDERLRQALRQARAWGALPFYGGQAGVFSDPDGRPGCLTAWEQTEILRRGALLREAPRALVEYVAQELAPFFLERKVDPAALKDFLSGWLIDLLGAGADMETASGIRESMLGTATLDEAVDMFDYLATRNADPQPRLHPEVQRALALIDEKIAEPLTLNAVAWEVALSPYYLSRLFHAQTGKQFNKYVMERRIERAAQLLRQSSLKVYEVSNLVGISNYRYFVTQFKKQMRMTPMEYRRNV